MNALIELPCSNIADCPKARPIRYRPVVHNCTSCGEVINATAQVYDKHSLKHKEYAGYPFYYKCCPDCGQSLAPAGK